MKAIWERSYPYLLGLTFSAAYLFTGEDLTSLVNSRGFNITEVFSSTFDFATVLTGLLFAVYILALVPGGGFLAQIFSTETFSIFRRYVIEALVFGLLTTLISWPLRALSEVPNDPSTFLKGVFLVWVFIAITALLLFIRVAHVFFVFESAGRKRKRLCN